MHFPFIRRKHNKYCNLVIVSISDCKNSKGHLSLDACIDFVESKHKPFILSFRVHMRSRQLACLPCVRERPLVIPWFVSLLLLRQATERVSVSQLSPVELKFSYSLAPFAGAFAMNFSFVPLCQLILFRLWHDAVGPMMRKKEGKGKLYIFVYKQRRRELTLF